MEMQENQHVSLSAVEGTAKRNSGESGEIALDIRDDLVSAQNTNEGGDSETKLVEKRPSSIGSQISFHARKVAQELRRKTSSKMHNNKKVERVESETALALRGLQFITEKVGSEGWSKVELRFQKFSDNGALPKERFGECLGMDRSEEFAGELYDSLARRRGITSTSINKAELQEFWKQITDESFDARLRTFFDMMDKNADGRINKEELKEIIDLSASANHLSKIQEHAEEYATLIMEELDPGNLGYIELQNLETLFLLQDPNQPAPLSADSRQLSRLLSQKLVPTKEQNNIKYYYEGLIYFTKENWKKIWVMAMWISICVGLFTWKFIQYKHRAVFDVMGYCVSTAKGAAETLKFNMALILLPVCRKTLTWLRTRTKLGAVISFDDNIDFHKIIAGGIGIGVGLHAGAHLTCDYPRLLHATDQEYEAMKPFFGEVRPKDYWWFIKDTEGWTGVVMVVLMSVSFTLAQSVFRRNTQKLPKTVKRLTGFNAFWYSHHLFVIVYALSVVHGYYLYLTKEWYKKTTWMYLAVPITLYASERLIRAFRSTHKFVQISGFALYPGNVLALHMKKPQGFTYTSGQYLFVKCSDVSRFEWHPFSITSAPGEDVLSIHIRSLGDWTSQIRYVFSKAPQPPSNAQQGDNTGYPNNFVSRSDTPNFLESPPETFKKQNEEKPSLNPKTSSNLRWPKLQIDGPYGAPAQDYKNYDVILLVGLGIGATPLISIVKDVFHNIKQQKDLKEGIPEKENKPFATKRAYFYWSTREEGSFEWFKNVMNEVAEKDEDGTIEIHNYCTSVYEEGDARSALITMLQSINHAKNGLDIVSGTRARTHFGRPIWPKVFKHVANNHPNKRVGLFYCGPHNLVGELKQEAKHFSRNTSTQFDFHKENF